MSDFTFNIPKLEVPLPSLGKTYPLGRDDKPIDKVTLRAMTAKDENILHSPAYVQSGFAFVKVVQSCITPPINIEVADMLVGDANLLLFMLRVLSYGNEYKASGVECPECKAKFEFDFDLTKGSSTKELIVEPTRPNENRFDFALPQSGHKIEFMLETRTVNNEIEAINKKLKKNHSEQSVTTRLKNLILTIDGKEDKKLIAEFVDEHLTSKDSLALRNYMNSISPRLDLKQQIICPECGETVEVDIPLDYTFLYPVE